MFLMMKKKIDEKSNEAGFNPLIQVYVFNQRFDKLYPHLRSVCFNPLIQVYVFNFSRDILYCQEINSCFNPLIQVYVFNENEWCKC